MFEEFPKMARLNRDCVISEKIDGTNAQVFIEQKNVLPAYDTCDKEYFIAEKDELVMMAGSRTRWISPKNDNHGFAKWVQANADMLFSLGVGRHFGEWWGSGIQRGYGLTKGEKRFSLFNADRWSNGMPPCCHIVPVLYRGLFCSKAVEDALYRLEFCGSLASPGFKDPEGVVIYHTAARSGFKVTLKNDEQPKSLVK